jgi:hypothetical protein
MMTEHEHRRCLLWTAWCEHSAVLPEVRRLAALHEAHGEYRAYRHESARLVHIQEALGRLETDLWALDPAWTLAVLDWRTIRGVRTAGDLAKRAAHHEEEHPCP